MVNSPDTLHDFGRTTRKFLMQPCCCVNKWRPWEVSFKTACKKYRTNNKIHINADISHHANKKSEKQNCNLDCYYKTTEKIPEIRIFGFFCVCAATGSNCFLKSYLFLKTAFGQINLYSKIKQVTFTYTSRLDRQP